MLSVDHIRLQQQYTAENKRRSAASRQFSLGAKKDPLASSVWFTLLVLISLRSAEGFSTTKGASIFSSKRFDTSLACQLLGVNACAPYDCTTSFQKLARRGGDTDIHSHGWGLAYYCDKSKALRALRDSAAAASSPIAKSISELRSQNVISHIRFATEGSVCMDNVHPFSRQLFGKDWVFAHNGDVPMFKGTRKTSAWLGGNVRGENVFEPIGETDSEALFCAILNSVNASFSSMPPLPILHDYINTLCQEIVSYDSQSTILNFLLGFGEQTQIAYSWPGRREGSTTWNGLHYKLSEEGQGRVAVIATKPLVDGGEAEGDWIELKRGECLLFENGEVHSTPGDSDDAELYALNLFDESFQHFSQIWEADALSQSFGAHL
jgi:glutamine amidotransferase